VTVSSGPLCLPAGLTPVEGPSYPGWAQHFPDVLEKENLVLLPEIGPRFLAYSIPAKSFIATPPHMNRPASRNVLFVRNAKRRMKSIFYVVATLVRSIQSLPTCIALNGNFCVEKQKEGIDRLGM
jgi:hypothetical protein